MKAFGRLSVELHASDSGCIPARLCAFHESPIILAQDQRLDKNEALCWRAFKAFDRDDDDMRLALASNPGAKCRGDM